MADTHEALDRIALIVQPLEGVSGYHEDIWEDDWHNLNIPICHDRTWVPSPLSVHIDRGDWVQICHGFYQGDFGLVRNVAAGDYFPYPCAQVLLVPRICQNCNRTDTEVDYCIDCRSSRPSAARIPNPPSNLKEHILRNWPESSVTARSGIHGPTGLYLAIVALDSLLPSPSLPRYALDQFLQVQTSLHHPDEPCLFAMPVLPEDLFKSGEIVDFFWTSQTLPIDTEEDNTELPEIVGGTEPT